MQHIHTSLVVNNMDNTIVPKPTLKVDANAVSSAAHVAPSRPSKRCVYKPILKWVGGKTQILDKLIAKFPGEMNNYREIFVGGGSVLLALLSLVKSGNIKVHGRIYAHDLNEPLIYTYKNIQTNHVELYDEIRRLIEDFNACGDGEVNRTPKTVDEAMVSRENYYYWIRSEYNRLCSIDKQTPKGSAMFIFLNKTCFRGVYRVGPNGFNVPYGHYKRPEIINQAHLNEVHSLIQNVVFECNDFSASLSRTEPGDYVYLDPPYVPETTTSFVGYTACGFNLDNHCKLFDMIHGLVGRSSSQHAKIMLSNADVNMVRDQFGRKPYVISSILCKRSINSTNPESKAKEVIITNY